MASGSLLRAARAAETAEAGAILADVQTAADEAGRLFPLSLASEGSARIGGLLATNAGGVNVLRYGNARGGQAVIYVRHIRRYYDLLVWAENSRRRDETLIALN